MNKKTYRRVMRLLYGLLILLLVVGSFRPPNIDPAPPPIYCDGVHAEYPSVVKVKATYYAYYSGDGCAWQIYYATSSDGVHFDKQGAINIDDGWAEQRAFPLVLFSDGHFKLYYGGGYPYQIGYAESTDGVNFTAAAKPVLPLGNAGAWDADQVLRPSVVINSSPSSHLLQRLNLAATTRQVYLMYYNGFGNNQSAVGLAYSIDGTSWQRYSQNPVFTSTAGIYTSFALSHNGTTYLYYHTGKAIYLAESNDAISFTPYSAEPVLSPSTSDGWDAGLVYGAFVRPTEEGGYVMYYNGISGVDADYGMIGLAYSNDLIHYQPWADNPVLTVGNTPADFTASANADDAITLSWHDVVTNAYTYTLEYGLTAGVYSAAIDVSGRQSYTFRPRPGRDYYVRVVADTNGVEGYPSVERMVYLPDTPTVTLPPSAAINTATPKPASANLPPIMRP